MATKILFSGASQQKLLNGASVKDLEETAVTNGTDDTDIIECSIIENDKKQQCKLRRKSGTVKPKNNSNFQSKNDNDEKQLNSTNCNGIASSQRLSLKKICQILGSPANVLEKDFSDDETPLKTPVSCGKQYSDSRQKKLLSESLKKISGEIPYLSKTKLNNIERWLENNNFGVARTPPFANLSITPLRGSKTHVLNRRKERDKFDISSSLDSDVEGVLKAVYGDDWMAKKGQGKCKTEPKRRMNRNVSPITSLRKGKCKESRRPFKRSLLLNQEINLSYDEEKEKNLNDSLISGVEMIHLDDSSASLDRLKVNELKEDFQKKKSREKSRKPELMSSPSSKGEAPGKRTLSSVKKTRKKTTGNAVATNADSVPAKTPKRTFLASLSVSTPTSRCHPDAKYFKINFKSKKEELIKKLYKLYKSEVFEDKLPDDLNFSWNIKLRGTAGYCYNKRITKSTGDVVRTSRIEFSTKIVDRADRLRDTMIHELCHAASWIIDGTLDGHGAIWSAWAAKAMKRFPELPLIKRCHNYDIFSKYLYRCTGCGYSIKRHSKSINVERKRCGYCYGILELLMNKKRRGKTEVPEFDATRTLRTPNKFAVFVKENYHTIKSNRADAKHAEIMKILSQQYALTKSKAT